MCAKPKIKIFGFVLFSLFLAKINDMKRVFLFLLLFLLTCPLCAQVSVISVSDEDKHSTKEDFYHTFEYFVISAAEGEKDPSKGGKCQATRVGKRWFATAAHCVAQTCAKGCTLRMDLISAPVSALAQVTHTVKKPVVFVHPKYKDGSPIQYDFALIELDPRRADKMYYRRATKERNYNLILPKVRFEQWLARNPKTKSAYLHALSPQIPPIAVFDGGNYVVDRTISVISIFDGVRAVQIDKHPVYYLKNQKVGYGDNFGIRKGMSGSGVMTNTGELIGIISANVSAVWQQNKKVTKESWFVFPMFNEDLMSFMRDTMGNDYYDMEQVDAYPYLASKTQKDFSRVEEFFSQVTTDGKKRTAIK